MVRVIIVETGISLMELLDCHSFLILLLFSRLVTIDELTYIVGVVLTHHLVYIAAIFQLLLSVMRMTDQ